MKQNAVLGILCVAKQRKETKNDMKNYTTNHLTTANETAPARGDVGFGNEAVIACCESNHVPYLFKVRRTRLVKDLFRHFLGVASAWRDAGEGWQCVDTRLALGGWSRQRRVLLMRRPVEMKPRRRKDPPRREFQAILPGLDLVTASDGLYADGYEEAVTTRRRLQSCVARIASHGRRRTVTIFTSGKNVARRVFGEISNVLEKVSAASQLKVEERWMLLVYYAFRKYPLVHRLYPPLMDNQIMLPLA